MTCDTLARLRWIFMSHSWMHLFKIPASKRGKWVYTDVGWCNLFSVWFPITTGHCPTTLCTTLSKLQSKPRLSAFIMAACQVDVYRLGPRDTVSIDFNCKIEILQAHYCAFLLNSEELKSSLLAELDPGPALYYEILFTTIILFFSC